MVKCKNCLHSSGFEEDECGNYWFQCLIDGCWMEENQYYEEEPCDGFTPLDDNETEEP